MHAVTFDHGLHLVGTPLWFDAVERRELCIVTGIPEDVPPPHSRLLTSASMAVALEGLGHGHGVLPTPWMRWVGVGGHRVQLIDAEAAPGCSAALVMAGDAPLLVTGALRAQPAAWPLAAHVVASMPALRHRGAPLGAVAQQIAQRIAAHADRALGLDTPGPTAQGSAVPGFAVQSSAVQSSNGANTARPVAAAARRRAPFIAATRRPTVWVDSLEVGLALHAALLALGVTLTALGTLARLVSKAPPKSHDVAEVQAQMLVQGMPVAHLAVAQRGEHGAPSPDGMGSDAIRVDSGLGVWALDDHGAEAAVALRWYADLTALQQVLAQTRARRVSLTHVPPSLHAAVRCALGPQLSTHFLGDARQLPLKVSHPAMI